MRVALVTGSIPPEPCGVGAYAELLGDALHACDVDAHIVHGKNWAIKDVSEVRRRIDVLRPDVVHIQYPTRGYGAHLGPHMLSLARPGVLTLHEMSHTHVLRQLAAAAFVVSAEHVVFTTESERRYLLRFAPWLRTRSNVIPIGTNIPRAKSTEGPYRFEVVHFGLIRPEKGIEQVIELAAAIHDQGLHLGVRVVGAVPQDCEKYFRRLKSSAAALPITWDIGLPATQVAEVLAGSAVGYVPFPDGASGRRASLLALLDANVPTITTRGADTPAELAGAVMFADSATEALRIAETLVADRSVADALRVEGRRFVAEFSWERIASLHRALYEDVLRRRARRPRWSRRPAPVR